METIRQKEEITTAYLNEEQLAWCDKHLEEAQELLRTLGRIPAPSHDEGRRAAFVRDWLAAAGAENLRIDEAQNVVYTVRDEGGPVNIVMAHTDIVFPDTEPLAMREENGRLYAPGIGDDTANLVNLMMAAKYLIENGVPAGGNLVIVANSCEEGLGNLKGSRLIMETYSGRVEEFISLDGGLGHIVNDAVGSVRMRVTINAQGGHSYNNFGNTNAIAQMSELVTELYKKKAPAGGTYNVGVIEGGTTVNSICARCSMLCEYRYGTRAAQEDLAAYFEKTIRDFREKGFDILVETLGIRPCADNVDGVKLASLTTRMAAIQKEYTSWDCRITAGSTDANSALSLGIPAVTFGTVSGEGAHTRGEWVEMASMRTGLKVALAAVLTQIG